jgi:uracil-DNA glycosylase family protein
MDATVKKPRSSLKQVRADEAACRRCPLYKNATQVVPAEGPARARITMVGEQPGDKEDRTGRPFAGSAGRVLDEAMEEAGIDCKDVFVTNAVKHFKFEMRGKRRLHKKPNTYEIERCRWWIDLDRVIVKPAVVVALGATAEHSLTGKTMTIRQDPRPCAGNAGRRARGRQHPSVLYPAHRGRARQAGAIPVLHS